MLLPFLIRFQIAKMNIKRRIREFDFASEQQHRYNQRADGAQKHQAGNGWFVKIGHNHRGQRQYKGRRRAGLDDVDQAQPIAQAADLPQETLGIIGRDIVADHLVMQVTDQIGQHSIAVAEIYHHQGNGGKEHANNQNVLPHRATNNKATLS